MIKEIPILISTPLITPIMNGLKTMTRRVSGLDSINNRPNDWEFVRFEDNGKGGLNAVFKRKDSILHTSIPCRYGRKGSWLWVRESFRVNSWSPDDGELTFRYEADGAISPYMMVDSEESECDVFNKYWEQSCDDLMKAGYELNENECYSDYDYKALRLRPNIFLRKEAARIWLRVESVRVERLQDISEEDAMKEGIEHYYDEDEQLWFRGYTDEADGLLSPSESFRTLWQSINGADSWQANPFVWVISFTVLSTTGKPDLQTT